MGDELAIGVGGAEAGVGVGVGDGAALVCSIATGPMDPFRFNCQAVATPIMRNARIPTVSLVRTLTSTKLTVTNVQIPEAKVVGV